jgi:hypothetical protein
MLDCCLAGFPDHLTPDDPDKPLTAALGDANLAWRATHTGLDAWGSDLFCPSPPPLFQLQLLVREGVVQLVPSLDDVRGAVLRVFDGVIEAGQSVEDLGEKVGGAKPGLYHLHCSNPHVCDVRLLAALLQMCVAWWVVHSCARSFLHFVPAWCAL